MCDGPRDRRDQFLPELVEPSPTHPERQQLREKPTRHARDLPALVHSAINSQLVHHRLEASASDYLAAASVKTGTALPLMIGNRSRFVVNLVGDASDNPPPPSNSFEVATQQQHHHHQQQVSAGPKQIEAVVPQNTALRAEQRRQNMSISVVRPVINTSAAGAMADANSPSLITKAARKSSLTGQQPVELANSRGKFTRSLVDTWMSLEQQQHHHHHRSQFNTADLIQPTVPTVNVASDGDLLDQLILGAKMSKLSLNSNSLGGHNLAQQYLKSEQELRQQTLLLRREEHELSRSIKRQHQFLVAKIDERKRNLRIIQSVWLQRDFKHAIEKLVDLYHLGLVFSGPNGGAGGQAGGVGGANKSQLQSMNTSLVVDVIGIIILRPKLWNLEICLLLLPILINDLLMQQFHEYYIEVALKALKLILTHFSAVIKGTLDSLKETNKLQTGVDLSREDRVNKCLACYKLLLEAYSLIGSRLDEPQGPTSRKCSQPATNNEPATTNCKLNALYRESFGLLSSLSNSIDLNDCSFAQSKRSQQNHS